MKLPAQPATGRAGPEVATKMVQGLVQGVRLDMGKKCQTMRVVRG